MTRVRPASWPVARSLARLGAWLLVLAPGLGAAPATAQAVVGPGESTETAFRREVRGHWFSWLSSHEDGNTALASEKVGEILRHAQKIGIRRLTDIALAATLVGRQELSVGKTDAARRAFETATRLDPDLPEPRWASFSLALSEKKWGELPGALLSAVRASWVDLESRRISRTRLVLLLVLTASGVGLALALSMILAHARRYYHDLKETSAHAVHRFGEGATHVLALALFLLPALLAFDLFWLLVVLFAATFGYAGRRQKIAAAVGLASLLPILPLLDYFAYELAVSSSPIVRGAESLRESRYDQQVLDDLETVKSAIPDDADVRYLLGCLYQAFGQNDRAVAEYTSAAQVSPSESRSLVNRGNIRFVDGDFGLAQEDFQEALKRESRNVAARYNLSLVYAETFRTVEAAQTLQEARALDAALVQRFQDRTSVVKVVSLSFPLEDAERKVVAMASNPRIRRLLGHFRTYDPVAGWLSPTTLGLVFALVLAFVLDRVRRRGRGYSQECQKCGRTFCRLCKPPGESALLCSQCVHVYLKKAGVSIETALQKVEEARRRKSLGESLTVVWNLLLPGSSSFFASRIGWAVTCLGLFFFGLLAAFGWSDLVVLPRPGLPPTTAGFVLPLVLSAVGWVLGQWELRRS